jgi:hypothetical protein
MQNNYVLRFQSSFCTRLFMLVDLLIIDNIRGFDSEDYSKDLFLFTFLSFRIEISKI